MKPVSAILVITVLVSLGATMGAVGQDKFINARCFNCGKLYRVPVQDKETVVVTCPHCGTKAKIKMPEPTVIAWEKASKYIGKEKVIEGKIVKTYKDPRSNNVYLNLNPDYKTYGSVVIKSEDLGKFGGTPEATLEGKKVRVKGKIVEHKGKPRIWLTDPGQIEVLE